VLAAGLPGSPIGADISHRLGRRLAAVLDGSAAFSCLFFLRLTGGTAVGGKPWDSSRWTAVLSVYLQGPCPRPLSGASTCSYMLSVQMSLRPHDYRNEAVNFARNSRSKVQRRRELLSPRRCSPSFRSKARPWPSSAISREFVVGGRLGVV